MRDLVRRDVAPECVRAAARSEYLIALSGIAVREIRHVNERGPRLSEDPGWLLRPRAARVRGSAARGRRAGRVSDGGEGERGTRDKAGKRAWATLVRRTRLAGATSRCACK